MTSHPDPADRPPAPLEPEPGATRMAQLQYRPLFIDHPQPMFVYDPVTHRFLAVNRACEARYGYGAAEFLSMTVARLLAPPDQEIWLREVVGRPVAGPRRRDACHVCKDGSVLEVEIFANDLVFQGSAARVVQVLDVSGQRQAERELRRSEARFRALSELSADWFWEQDAQLRFISLEGRAGLPPDVPGLGEGLVRHLESLRQQPFRDFELRHRDADGSERIFSLSGLPVFDDEGRFAGYRGVGRDRTQAHWAQDALRESQRMLAALMGNLPGMAYRSRNAPDWPFEFASQGALKLTGYPARQLVGGNVRYGDLIHPDDRERVWDGGQRALAARRQFQLTYRIVAAGGQEKWVWEQGSGAEDEAGRMLALEGFVIDITETRQAQEQVARFNLELEERVRLRTGELETANRELEAFSYSIAHDLRAPLTSIDGFSHALSQHAGPRLDERGRHFLGRIRAGVHQMGDLTEAMLSLAKLSRVSLRSEPVDLAALARKTIEQLHESEPGRELVAEIAPQLWTRGDSRLLGQVMANLLGNAWKFSSRQALTHIRVACEIEADGTPVYVVSDRGAGFDMSYAGRLFNAFQRLHGAADYPGTGVGLALVHKIIGRHGGRIWAESAPDQGATFRFTLGGASDGRAAAKLAE